MNRLAFVLVLACVVSGALAWNVAGQESNQAGKFMRLKLGYAQGALEGIVLADYDRIAVEAQRLDLMSKEASWQILQTEEYARLSDSFQRVAAQLGREAKAKNLDGATIAYFNLTQSCVNCHRHVRDQK